ncbi:hypothetical protein TRV_04940 [Trichophyton verrucosum HKI 0517]|uniref:Rad60/SUMO-like domain-containing protein n=1 Tax=Trichophyton verrucosum (strain HKI 0517) TaxID=663202 RepID=D4DCT5_TRIVH|nr:uncharacterized protein TRV_04940 [Trichophyton verrucosum HKI 0517]EFE40328.1 hypothetical protein TRV_04940 [Trichophyton verrucosum HKI 0517]
MADLPPQSMPAPVEHLNIKVTDNNNEVFFKIKRSTQLKKLMDAFCERQGKQLSTVRFLFDGTRVRPDDSPETLHEKRSKPTSQVCPYPFSQYMLTSRCFFFHSLSFTSSTAAVPFYLPLDVPLRSVSFKQV